VLFLSDSATITSTKTAVPSTSEKKADTSVRYPACEAQG
jgi:hypothetical protein